MLLVNVSHTSNFVEIRAAGTSMQGPLRGEKSLSILRGENGALGGTHGIKHLYLNLQPKIRTNRFANGVFDLRTGYCSGWDNIAGYNAAPS
jgi:hypothetical protein